MKKAIIFGSSGFVGSHLLSELLNSPEYEQVTAVVRKNLSISHPKLNTLIGDYRSLPALEPEISADEVFIALGATRATSPEREKYYQVDHDYPVLAARIAKARGAKSVFLVTAVGANPHSRVFYVRTKGETERDITALDFEHTHIFRPSMIMGDPQPDPGRQAQQVQGHGWGGYCQSYEEFRDQSIGKVEGVSLEGNERFIARVVGISMDTPRFRQKISLLHL